jgi:hypothetical protein
MCRRQSTNPLERLNGEIKPRTEVVGIFPIKDAIVRLVGATCSNKMMNVGPACPLPMRDDPTASLPAIGS